MRRLFLILIVCFCFSCGCGRVELFRLAGIGIRPFKEHGKSYSKSFPIGYSECYAKVLSILQEMGAKVYRGSAKKGFLVAVHFSDVFLQCNDTTEVAVFFSQGYNRTSVEVVSLNHALSEFVAGRLFPELEG